MHPREIFPYIYGDLLIYMHYTVIIIIISLILYPLFNASVAFITDKTNITYNDLYKPLDFCFFDKEKLCDDGWTYLLFNIFIRTITFGAMTSILTYIWPITLLYVIIKYSLIFIRFTFRTKTKLDNHKHNKEY